ncbi:MULTISPECIES: hypothetical protein [unclassified Rhodococcus (in: high G+C Gram-positive bacteria)]|jgi:hypothetical protein|uniref:hypothetical protein n=1 Tax=unclassified Rhodococcus (in: high G+C Gram-positive bacteria) TaxID=192944 RepID=UPI0015C5D717|nr:MULTISPECIES: hypothetical protein [unclassified Rhodococcus (in: high G+C Gram-positive bacteria)]
MHTEHTTHTWTTHSTHNTSEGLVGYQGCRCGAQRIVTVPTHTFAPVAEVAHRA